VGGGEIDAAVLTTHQDEAAPYLDQDQLILLVERPQGVGQLSVGEDLAPTVLQVTASWDYISLHQTLFSFDLFSQIERFDL